jgi:hypothetical protein
MHGRINVKSSNNISKWQMGFNSAFKGLNISGLSHRRTSEQLGTLQEGLLDSPLSIWWAWFCIFPSAAVSVVVDDARP